MLWKILALGIFGSMLAASVSLWFGRHLAAIISLLLMSSFSLGFYYVSDGTDE